MSMDRMTELLTAHADELNKHAEVAPDTFLTALPDQREDLASLLQIAARSKHALKPVVPAPEFRARLRDGLRMAASHREMHQLLVSKPDEPPWGLLVGAAALGSAASLLAILLRSRQAQHTSRVDTSIATRL